MNFVIHGKELPYIPDPIDFKEWIEGHKHMSTNFFMRLSFDTCLSLVSEYLVQYNHKEEVKCLTY